MKKSKGKVPFEQSIRISDDLEAKLNGEYMYVRSVESF